jgi:isopentenyl phosphate kinase
MLLSKNKKIIFIKLGGSLITDKEKPLTAKIPTIEKIAIQVKKIIEKNPNIQIILGNGSGSFGHFEANKYQIKDGIKNEEQKFGFCVVSNVANKINRIIIDELLKQKINAVSVSPATMSYATNGKLKIIFIDPVLNYLKLNIIPVVYGDIVYDDKLGCKIFSTEITFANIIEEFLKRKIKIDSVINMVTVGGVMDKGKNIIPKISQKNYNNFADIFSETSGFDVTGGMRHKVEYSLKLTKNKIKSYIIDGNIENNLERVIDGENFFGTLIE